MKTGRSGPQGPNKQMLTRTLILMGVCGIFSFLVLAVQLFNIQILQHEELEQRAIRQQLRAITVSAGRGTIFDSTGTILGMSAGVENVFISPNSIHVHGEDRELIATGLSEILGVDQDMILSRMENTASFYQTVKNRVEREEADLVREFIVEHELRSVHLEPATRRYYPRGRTASHILGFVGAEGTGMGYGVEGSYDRYLTGVNGRIVRLKNARGIDMLLASYEDYHTAQPGHDIHLTIDVNIQQILEKYLRQAERDFDLRAGGFALAMNPQTGAILGMASINDYNPNSHGVLDDETRERLRAVYPDDDEAFHAAVNRTLMESWLNKNIHYTYEPGSTFKLITLAIALEEGIACLHDGRHFYCAGNTMAVPGRVDPLRCAGGVAHGSLNLTQVMQRSCNIATVELAMEIGPEVFFEYLQAFGLFETTGVDLPGEALGQVWSEENWNRAAANRDLTSLAAASFGQTFTLTPIRLVTAIAALSNGGYIVEPHVVERVMAEDGTVIRENRTTVRRQVISRETSQAVLEVMERSVDDPALGTGRNAAVPGFRIGGKTGTSTDTVLEARTGEKEYIVSFVSAAPIDDPEIVLLVSLQSPGPRNTVTVAGGTMAAPTVGRMLTAILPYLNHTPAEPARVNIQVPHVQQRSVEDARNVLQTEGFEVLVRGEGTQVIDQMPSSGAMVVAGTQVILFLEENRPEDEVAVPDVVGMGFEAARAALEAAGLYVRRSGTIAQGEQVRVYSQSRAPAEVVRRGAVIEIFLIDTSLEGQ
ncbi:MAG: penicillin-binding transpeptidase domain-containing protein [Oscillospiraceae bacterium]|nr:penicillin-binding transpeptidase domain-containing protein [Oscillospiraceae bacterium]